MRFLKECNLKNKHMGNSNYIINIALISIVIVACSMCDFAYALRPQLITDNATNAERLKAAAEAFYKLKNQPFLGEDPDKDETVYWEDDFIVYGTIPTSATTHSFDMRSKVGDLNIIVDRSDKLINGRIYFNKKAWVPAIVDAFVEKFKNEHEQGALSLYIDMLLLRGAPELGIYVILREADLQRPDNLIIKDVEALQKALDKRENMEEPLDYDPTILTDEIAVHYEKGTLSEFRKRITEKAKADVDVKQALSYLIKRSGLEQSIPDTEIANIIPVDKVAESISDISGNLDILLRIAREIVKLGPALTGKIKDGKLIITVNPLIEKFYKKFSIINSRKEEIKSLERKASIVNAYSKGILNTVILWKLMDSIGLWDNEKYLIGRYNFLYGHNGRFEDYPGFALRHLIAEGHDVSSKWRISSVDHWIISLINETDSFLKSKGISLSFPKQEIAVLSKKEPQVKEASIKIREIAGKVNDIKSSFHHNIEEILDSNKGKPTNL